MRAALLDEIRKPYVIAARTRGLSENHLIYKYPVRLAILPLINTIGWLLPTLVSGSVIVSIVLNLPTLGALLYHALLSQDMFLAGGCLLLLTVMAVVGMLISDLLLAWLDPCIRFG
jgi:peptide/nickel transport system permease protein